MNKSCAGSSHTTCCDRAPRSVESSDPSRACPRAQRDKVLYLDGRRRSAKRDATTRRGRHPPVALKLEPTRRVCDKTTVHGPSTVPPWPFFTFCFPFRLYRSARQSLNQLFSTITHEKRLSISVRAVSRDIGSYDYFFFKSKICNSQFSKILLLLENTFSISRGYRIRSPRRKKYVEAGYWRKGASALKLSCSLSAPVKASAGSFT